MNEEEDRTLDFASLLAELHGFVGRPVVVESIGPGGLEYHRSKGVLERSLDMHVAFPQSLDRPAYITFYLEGDAAQFTLRERAVRQARTWIADEGAWLAAEGGDAGEDERWRIRYVQILFAEQGELIVRDDWESELFERWERGKRPAP